MLKNRDCPRNARNTHQAGNRKSEIRNQKFKTSRQQPRKRLQSVSQMVSLRARLMTALSQIHKKNTKSLPISGILNFSAGKLWLLVDPFPDFRLDLGGEGHQERRVFEPDVVSGRANLDFGELAGAVFDF